MRAFLLRFKFNLFHLTLGPWFGYVDATEGDAVPPGIHWGYYWVDETDSNPSADVWDNPVAYKYRSVKISLPGKRTFLSMRRGSFRITTICKNLSYR